MADTQTGGRTTGRHTQQAETQQVDSGPLDTQQVDTHQVDTQQVDTGPLDTQQAVPSFRYSILFYIILYTVNLQLDRGFHADPQNRACQGTPALRPDRSFLGDLPNQTRPLEEEEETE